MPYLYALWLEGLLCLPALCQDCKTESRRQASTPGEVKRAAGLLSAPLCTRSRRPKPCKMTSRKGTLVQVPCPGLPSLTGICRRIPCSLVALFSSQTRAGSRWAHVTNATESEDAVENAAYSFFFSITGLLTGFIIRKKLLKRRVHTYAWKPNTLQSFITLILWYLETFHWCLLPSSETRRQTLGF